MKLSLSLKIKNILLIVIFLSICFICDEFCFLNTILTIFPHFTCYFKDTLGYSLYQTSEIYRFLHNNREITTCILGCLYFIFFRVYVFQKWVSIIENKCQGLFLHDFLKELRENKQILLYVNIIFLFFLFIMLDFYIEVSDINVFFATLFFIPFHYLILYIRWAIKDKNYKNKQVATKKYPIIQYINNLFLANFQMIISSYVIVFFDLIAKVSNPLMLICQILSLLFVFYILYYVYYYLVNNIKVLFITFSIIILFILLLPFLFVEEFNIIFLILLKIFYLFLFIGVIASILPNQVAKLIVNDSE